MNHDVRHFSNDGTDIFIFKLRFFFLLPAGKERKQKRKNKYELEYGCVLFFI